MRSLTFVKAGVLEWHEVEDPVLRGDGEALVRPVSVATCDLDRMIVAGRFPVAEPFAFGHEGVAEVVEVGGAVRTVAVGDLVSVPFQISCGECGACRRGHTGNCEPAGRLAMYGLPMGTGYGGLLADLARVPYADAMLVPLPDGVVPAAVASLSDNIPDAWRTVAPHLAERPGAPVLIAASGASITLYAVAIALALGAERVDVVGGTPALRSKAEALGARLLDERFPRRLGAYPITVDTSGDPDGLGCALRSTEAEGICTSIGIYLGDTPVPLFEMYTNGVRFHTGRVHARPTMDPLLELVRSGSFRPELITGETASWSEAAEAVAAHRAKLVISR